MAQIVDVDSNTQRRLRRDQRRQRQTTVNVGNDSQDLTQLVGDLTVNGDCDGDTQLVLFDTQDNNDEDVHADQHHVPEHAFRA